MTKINSYADLIAEYPWLAEALLLSPRDALWMAYRTGRLDGGIDVLNRQSTAEAMDAWADEGKGQSDA